MKNIIKAAALAALLTGPGSAWAADEWGLPEEEVVRFDAKVVDILCELTGDCADNCGGGERQLGLLTGEGALVMPIKNVTPFAGTAAELLDFCGKQVTADGLYSTNRGYKVFALQFVKEAPGGKWRRANRFLPKWAEANGYRIDYAVNSDLEFHPEILKHYNLVLSVGHDEYWSSAMRDHLEQYIADGGNVAFFADRDWDNLESAFARGSPEFFAVSIQGSGGGGIGDDQPRRAGSDRLDQVKVLSMRRRLYEARNADVAVDNFGGFAGS